MKKNRGSQESGFRVGTPLFGGEAVLPPLNFENVDVKEAVKSIIQSALEEFVLCVTGVEQVRIIRRS